MKMKPGRKTAEECRKLILDCPQLKEDGGIISTADAAEILGQSRSAASQFVNEMADDGYLDRVEGTDRALYRKSARRLARMPWRRRTNEQLGIMA